jgi:hypothetical protein
LESFGRFHAGEVGLIELRERRRQLAKVSFHAEKSVRRCSRKETFECRFTNNQKRLSISASIESHRPQCGASIS